MEPKNHPIEQEHHLPSFSGSMLIFQGVVVIAFVLAFFTPSVCLEDKSKWCFCWLAPWKLTETLTIHSMFWSAIMGFQLDDDSKPNLYLASIQPQKKWTKMVGLWGTSRY